MPYLIDGHNLIGQLPDIHLSDPDDEAQLVLKLRRFAGRVGKKIIVVFDKGLPAGVEKSLSTHSIEVRFASEKSSADQVLRNLILKTPSPQGWIVISSDVEITHIANQRGMQVMSAHQFAQQLSAITTVASPKTKQQRQAISKKTHPNLSQAEIDEWLSLFDRDE